MKLKWRYKCRQLVAKINLKMEDWQHKKMVMKQYEECWINKINIQKDGVLDNHGLCYGRTYYGENYARIARCINCPYAAENQKGD